MPLTTPFVIHYDYRTGVYSIRLGSHVVVPSVASRADAKKLLDGRAVVC